jgi:putative Mn2+ efflux pump MntP
MVSFPVGLLDAYGTMKKMDMVTIFLIAVGLAMDAFAVSVARGMTANKDRLRSAIFLALLFGGFQALMPLIGWLAGLSFKDLIMNIDHWIAFGLLSLIGGKMIFDAVKGEESDDKELTPLLALTLAVATSIDALMVGLSFAFLETSILVPMMVIGSVTFALCFIGFIFGSSLGGFFGGRIRIVGGAILILIGIRILVEHLL